MDRWMSTKLRCWGVGCCPCGLLPLWALLSHPIHPMPPCPPAVLLQLLPWTWIGGLMASNPSRVLWARDWLEGRRVAKSNVYRKSVMSDGRAGAATHR